MDVATESLKPLEYFSHDTSARHDPKCKRLRLVGGMEAYGRWWCLCEYLGFADTHILPFADNLDKAVLASELECSVEEAEDFLDSCARLGLINAELWEQGKVSSDRMARNALDKARKSIAGRAGGRKKQSA